MRQKRCSIIIRYSCYGKAPEQHMSPRLGDEQFYYSVFHASIKEFAILHDYVAFQVKEHKIVYSSHDFSFSIASTILEIIYLEVCHHFKSPLFIIFKNN